MGDWFVARHWRMDRANHERIVVESVIEGRHGFKRFIKGDVCACDDMSACGNINGPSCLINREANEDSAHASLNETLLVKDLGVIVAACVNLGNNWAPKDAITPDVRNDSPKIQIMRGSGDEFAIRVQSRS